MSGKAEDKNIESTLKTNNFNTYCQGNQDYWDRIKKRIGKVSTCTPTYSGGNLQKANDFLLPAIESGIINDELLKVRNDSSKHDFKLEMDIEFLMALEYYNQK